MRFVLGIIDNTGDVTFIDSYICEDIPQIRMILKDYNITDANNFFVRDMHKGFAQVGIGSIS